VKLNMYKSLEGETKRVEYLQERIMKVRRCY